MSVSMANEWQPSTVGDFCPFIYGKGLPERSRIPGVFPVISSAGISGTHNEPLVTTGGVVIGRKSTVGSVTLSKSPFWAIDTAFYIADEPQRDLRFTYYLLKTLGLDRMNSDSAVPGLNRDNAHARTILVPELKEQRAIAHILGTLDDKIELNRKQNETLEAMARTLFKAWFVDFEPVRAKMEGRWQRGQSLPGLPAHLYDLFPDRLVESELGKIPEGWQVGSLEDLLVLQRGFDLPTRKRTDGTFPIIAASGHNGTHSEAMVKGPGVITGRSGVLGKVFLELGDFWPLNTTLWIKEFRAASPCYAYELMRGLDFQQFNAGSAVPTLNRNHVHGLPLVIPASEFVQAYEAIAMPLHQRAKQSDEQSHSLAQLRDTLLPKLISGELRVPDVKHIAETV